MNFANEIDPTFTYGWRTTYNMTEKECRDAININEMLAYANMRQACQKWNESRSQQKKSGSGR